MAELADAQDLKSCGTYLPYRFDSGRRHYIEKLQALVFQGFEAFELNTNAKMIFTVHDVNLMDCNLI